MVPVPPALGADWTRWRLVATFCPRVEPVVGLEMLEFDGRDRKRSVAFRMGIPFLFNFGMVGLSGYRGLAVGV
ncbi:MAG: hypothetical protein JWM43_3904 [Acidobacteriaceae bacterium]|nr:hypothetical protein [Acidobacteriaceae bacterium]